VTLGILVAGSGNVSAWQADVSFHHPSTTYEDTTHTFSVDIENTGPDSMRLSSVGLHFDWVAENYYYFASGLPLTLGSGVTRTFSFEVHVPQGITTNAIHIATVRVEAADPGLFGGWGTPTSDTVDFQFLVSPQPTGGVGGSGGLALGIIALAVVVAIAIVVAVVVVLIRKKPLPATPVNPAYPYAQVPPQPPGQPPTQPPQPPPQR